MVQELRNKVVVITGGSSGLGAETARHLVLAGTKVVLGALRQDRLKAHRDACNTVPKLPRMRRVLTNERCRPSA